MPKLSQIMNFDDVLDIMVPKFDNSASIVYPFQIAKSEEAIAAYELRSQSFERYLTPGKSNTEITNYLREYKDPRSPINLDDHTLLRLSFRLSHFYLLSPLSYAMNPAIGKAINVFFNDILTVKLKSAISRRHIEDRYEKKSLLRALQGYFNFTVFLSLQPREFVFPVPLSRVTVSANRLNPLIGNFYPIGPFNNDVNDQCILGFNRQREDFETLYILDFSYLGETSIENESKLQLEFNKTYLDILSRILRVRFETLKINQNKEVSSTFGGVGIRTIPDIMINLLQNKCIPIELKYANIGSSFSSFKSSYGNFNADGLDFTKVFSQSLQQALTVESDLAVCADLSTIIWIDLKNAKFEPEFYKPETGKFLRGLHCNVKNLNAAEIDLTPVAILLCLIEQYGTNEDDSGVNIRQLLRSMQIPEETEKVFADRNYRLMNDLFDAFNEAANNIREDIYQRTRTRFTTRIMGSRPVSSNDAYKEETDRINGRFNLTFPPAYLKGLKILMSYDSWKCLDLNTLSATYAILEIISGQTNHSRFGIIVKLLHRETRKTYAMKMYDPNRSYINKLKQGDFILSMRNTFSYFSREVMVYNTATSRCIPTIDSFGVFKIRDEDIGKSGSVLSPDNLPLGGFYFLYEYLEGTLLSEMVFDQSLLNEALKSLEDLHAEGIYHQDLHPQNVLVQQDNDNFKVKFIDFGSSVFSNIRSKSVTPEIKWDNGKKLKKKNKDTRKEKDVTDLLNCFSVIRPN